MKAVPHGIEDYQKKNSVPPCIGTDVKVDKSFVRPQGLGASSAVSPCSISLEPDVTLIRLGRELLLVPGGGMVICSRAQALQQRKVFIRAWLLLMIRLTIGRGGRTAARSLVLLLGAADVLSVAFLHEEVDGAREQSSAPAQQSSVL